MICVILILFIATALVATLLMLQSLFRLSPRTASDVIAAVQRVNERDLEDLLDEIKEANLSDLYIRDRARLLHEYLRRAAFNALVILQWVYAEFERYRSPGIPEDADRERLFERATEECLAFRFYSMATLSRLFFWLLLHRVKILPAAGIARMRYLGGIDGLETYRQIISLAESISLVYGDDARRHLRIALHGND